jgi:dienelactone hydrolase
MVGLTVLCVAVAGLLYGPVDRHLRAAALLLRFENPDDPHDFADYGRHPVAESEESWSGGRARFYRPERDGAPGIVLVPGVHPDGIDEPRLIAFARALASAGVVVMTPEMPDLEAFELTPDAIGRIGAAATHLADDLRRERAGVVGISFSGGLALLAAASADHGARIAFVLSLGGHHDLARVSRWYIGQSIRGPNGEVQEAEPHPYGAGVLIYAHADQLFSPRGVEPARRSLAHLLAGNLAAARRDAVDAPLALEDRARLMQILDRQNDAELREALEVVIAQHGEDLEASSPSSGLAGIRAPVFLVHGTDDPVVPAVETRWLATEVPDEALESVLITDVLRHAEYEREPSMEERWEMVHFMAQVLAAAESS